MRPSYHYTTVLEALEELKEKGFVYDYNINHEHIVANPEYFSIEHVYRYEGDSDPDEESIVYGIISITGDKGVFVSGFSANSNNKAAQILGKLSTDSDI
jgi:hypothetical protein